MPTVDKAITPAALFAFRQPTQAIAFLQAKGLDRDAWNWFDLASEAHARSFTVARAGRLDVLQSIRDALVRAGNEAEFVRQLTPELQRLGWWGKQIVVAPDGGAEVAQLGSPRRLRTIYRSNMMSAYNQARYLQQLKDARSRPYWMYVAVMDSKTRPSHAALNGRVFRFDDPIWRSHYPPCDYNCRCRVRALTEGEVKRRGLKVESAQDALTPVETEVGVNLRTGETVSMPSVRWSGKDPRTGAPVSMTPHPAWSTNPALVPWQPDLDRYDYDLARWYVGETLQGPAFERTWRGIEERVARFMASPAASGLAPTRIIGRMEEELAKGVRYPVAVLDPASRGILGVQTQTVYLSDATLVKQAVSRKGQDLDFADYWRAQRIIEQATVVIQEQDEVLAFARSEDVWFVAIVKRTRDGRELFLTSFRRANLKSLAQQLRRGKVLKDAR